jgi:hypothetical protein
MKIQLKHSDVLAQGQAVAPAANQMEYGEVALNYNVNDVKLWTKASDNTIVSIVPTIGNGQINIDAGDGLTASGSNGTCNQTINTTRTLTVQAADNTIDVASGGIKVNTGNLGIPTVNDSQIALTAGDGLISVTTGTSTEAATSFTLNSSSGLTNTLKVKLDGTSLTAASAGLKLTTRSFWGQTHAGTADVTGAISGATSVTGSDAVMYVQPQDSATSRTLVLRGNNETDNSNAVGGGNVLIGDSARGKIYFQTGQTVNGYQFAKAGEVSITGSLKFDDLTTSRIYTFPNESGTIALTSSNPVTSVNNVSPDENGNINLTTTNIAGVITSINNLSPGTGSFNLTLGAGDVGAASANHDHGNIGNNGSLNSGGSAAVNVPLRTNGTGLIVAGVFASNTSTTAGEFVQASDSRLTDSRVPLSHVHGNISYFGELLNAQSAAIASSPLITDASGVITAGVFGSSSGQYAEGNHSHTGLADDNHSHGNIGNLGVIGSTANLPLITTTQGAVTVGSFGTNANTFCEGNDSRLSDARTPTSHSHGNITNDGKIGSSPNKPIITGDSGVLEAGAFGTNANTFCEGNDSRLSDARTPTSHSHGNITNDGKIGTAANIPIITGTNGVLEAGAFGTSSGQFAEGDHSHGSSAHDHDNDYAAANHGHGRITSGGELTNSSGANQNQAPLITNGSGLIVAGSFGTSANTFCEGNDSRLTAYTLPTATANDLGGIKVGTNLSITDGVLSALDQTYTLPTAASGTLGGVKVGSGLAINAQTGVLSVSLPIATADDVGGIKIGSRLNIDSDGVLSASDQSYTLPTASDEDLGGVIIGDGLTIDNDGVLSADDQTSHTHNYADAVHSHTIATATSTEIGGIKVGSNLGIDSNGILSADVASDHTHSYAASGHDHTYETYTFTTSVTSKKFIDSDNTNRYVDPAGTSELNNLNCAGNIVATGNVSASSDVRLKSEIELIEDALSKIKEIRGITYKRMGQRERNAGVIAQEVETVLPEVVKTDEDGFKSVCYGNMVGLLIEAVKELSERIEELELNR